MFYFQIIDKISDDDYDYQIIYCATNKGGFRLGRMQYCIFESEIISPLRPPKEQRVMVNSRSSKVIVFEEVVVEELEGNKFSVRRIDPEQSSQV